MKHSLIIVLSFICGSLVLLGQSKGGTQDSTFLPIPGPAINVAYYGETVLHSGIKVGYEYPLSLPFLETRWDRGLFLIGNIGYVSHRTVHRSIFASGEALFRIVPSGNLRLGVLVGLGVLRYSLASPAYELQAEGTFEQISSGGWRLMTTIGGDIGFQSKKGISWFSRPLLVFLTPHNHRSLTQINLEFGCSIPLTINQ